MQRLLQQQHNHELAAQVASIATSQQSLPHDAKHVKIWCHESF